MQYSTSITTKKDINHQIRNSHIEQKTKIHKYIFVYLFVFFFSIKNKNSFNIPLKVKFLINFKCFIDFFSLF